jgi:hypothetical protein
MTAPPKLTPSEDRLIRGAAEGKAADYTPQWVVSVNWWKKPGIEGLWRVEQLNYQVAITLPPNLD